MGPPKFKLDYIPWRNYAPFRDDLSSVGLY